MLGLYEFKHLVGENEIDYRLSAQNTYNLSIVFLKYHMNEIQLQQKHSYFEGETYFKST